MMKQTTVPFDITSWEQSSILESESGAKITRASIAKKYRGELEGESVAEGLMCGGGGGGAYIAMERVTGTLAGRGGSVVQQDGGTSPHARPPPLGHNSDGSG